MWGLRLFGTSAFTGACCGFNPVLREVRTMGIVVAYAIGAQMLDVLPSKVAVATWCVFAAIGGAVALGHPIGMSGNRLALTILHELRRRGGGVGAAALCGGGGQGDAILVRSL